MEQSADRRLLWACFPIADLCALSRSPGLAGTDSEASATPGSAIAAASAGSCCPLVDRRTAEASRRDDGLRARGGGIGDHDAADHGAVRASRRPGRCGATVA